MNGGAYLTLFRRSVACAARHCTASGVNRLLRRRFQRLTAMFIWLALHPWVKIWRTFTPASHDCRNHLPGTVDRVLSRPCVSLAVRHPTGICSLLLIDPVCFVWVSRIGSKLM